MVEDWGGGTHQAWSIGVFCSLLHNKTGGGGGAAWESPAGVGEGTEIGEGGGGCSLQWCSTQNRHTHTLSLTHIDQVG